MTIFQKQYFDPKLLYGCAAILLWWLSQNTVVALQDSAEMVSLSQSLLSGTSNTWQDLSYRAPLPLFIIGLFPQPLIALSWLAMMSAVLWVIPANLLAKRLGGTGWLIVLFTAFFWPIQLAGLTGDTRFLGIGLGLLGLEFYFRNKQFYGGLCLGLAALCRYEYLLFIGFPLLFILWDVLKKRDFSLRFLLSLSMGWLLSYGSWVTHWSIQRGRFQLTPRSWEMTIVSWLDFMPDKLIHLLVGTTSFSSPMRKELQRTARISSFPTLDYHFLQLPNLFYVLLFVGLCLFFIFRTLHNRENQRLVLCLLSVGLVGLLAASLPQGKSLVLLMLLPMFVCTIIFLDSFLGRPSHQWKTKIPLIFIIFFPFIYLQLQNGKPLFPPSEQTAATKAAQSWLATHTEYPSFSIDSSFAAHHDFGGRLGWNNLKIEKGYIVLTPMDDPWLVTTWLLPPQSTISLQQAWKTDTGAWAAIVLFEQ